MHTGRLSVKSLWATASAAPLRSALLLSVALYLVRLIWSSWRALSPPAPGSFTAARHGPLNYFSRPPVETHSGGGVTVVLVHGLGCSARVYVDYATKLGAHLGGYKIIAPDLLGHGASEAPSSEAAYTMRNQAALVLNLLRREPGPARFLLVGHSMGGAVVAHLAGMLEPRELVGVVFEEGNLDVGDAFASKKITESQGWRVVAAGVALVSHILPSSIISDSINYNAIVHCSKDLLTESKSGRLLPMLRQTSRPLLFMFGDLNRGRYTSEELLVNQGLEESIVYVPNTGHAMHASQPDFVFGRIARFIEDALSIKSTRALL